MRVLLAVAALCAAPTGAGCASAAAAQTAVVARDPAPVEATSGGEAAPAERLAALESEAALRDRRIRELESRLALADAEVRELRDEVTEHEDSVAESRAVVRIGETSRSTRSEPAREEPAPDDELAAEEEHDAGPRPVLRLYGPPELPTYAAPTGAVAQTMPAAIPGWAPAPAAQAAPFGGMPSMGAPPMTAGMPSMGGQSMSVLGPLPVVAPPGMRSMVPPIPDRPLAMMPAPPTASIGSIGPAPRRTGDDPAVREYQAALGHVASRHFEEALAGLGAFLSAHPQHPYADNAMYWRGEVLYMRRDFAAAERELAEMVRRFPQGNKVPDALLRLGFCRQRQGDVEGARSYFRRVRAEHPGTVAARLASREDT